MEADRRTPTSETAALVALLRAARRPSAAYAARLEETASAQVILQEEHGLLGGQLLDDAAAEVSGWHEEGFQLISLLDPGYPENLRSVYDRPALLFVRGQLERGDSRSVAVIGSRRASAEGLDRAGAITERLIDHGYTIVSGLAAGIDTVAHTRALDRGVRTIAVIGTGLQHAYPPQNESLQERIAANGALVSQFWPEAGPTRRSFPLRNAVMSGLALATIVVEATQTSGARTQVRAALRHGRPVLLASALLRQSWAREAAERPGVTVIRSLWELDEALLRVSATDAPVA